MASWADAAAVQSWPPQIGDGRQSRTFNRCMRSARLMRQKNAMERDKSEIAFLRAKLAELQHESTKYIIVEKPVEKVVEKIVEKIVEKEIVVSQAEGGKIFTEQQVMELFSSKVERSARRYEVRLERMASDFASQIQALRDNFEDKDLASRDELRQITEDRDLLAAELGERKGELSDMTRKHSESLRDRDDFKQEMIRYKTNYVACVDFAAERYEAALFNVVPLPSPDHGIIVGLRTSPELNGTVVLCEEWCSDRGRWRARAPDGCEMMLNHDNILRKDPPPSGYISSSVSLPCMSFGDDWG